MAGYHLCNDYQLQSKLAAAIRQWPRELSFDTVFHSVNEALDGIRNGRFWILAEGSATEEWLKTRTESILSRRNPDLRERA